MNGQQLSMYASPLQIMRDRTEFVQEGIRKGRSVLIFKTNFGAVIFTENRYKSLYKLGEIYDNLCFAATGRYNEFEPLRVAGIRMADIHGYTYSREDVNGKIIADMYSNLLATSFSNINNKPLEIEIGIVELINNQTNIYSIKFDGSIVENLDSLHVIGVKEEDKDYIEEEKKKDYSAATLSELLKKGMKILKIDDHKNIELLLMTHKKNKHNRHIERLTVDQIEKEIKG